MKHKAQCEIVAVHGCSQEQLDYGIASINDALCAELDQLFLEARQRPVTAQSNARQNLWSDGSSRLLPGVRRLDAAESALVGLAFFNRTYERGNDARALLCSIRTIRRCIYRTLH